MLRLGIHPQGLRGLFCAQTLTSRHEQATHRHGNDDQIDGDRPDHIDGRAQTETGAREDHHRQGGAAGAGEEGGDHHFIERQRERQQPGRHQGLRNGRQGDQHEHLERARAQIHGGFLDRPIHFLQTRLDDHRGIGNGHDGMADEDGEKPLLRKPHGLLHCHEKQQQRQRNDHGGHDQRDVDHEVEQALAREVAIAHQGKCRQCAQQHRSSGRRQRHLERQNQAADDFMVMHHRAVPLERPAAPNGDHARIVERIHHQHHDGQV